MFQNGSVEVGEKKKRKSTVVKEALPTQIMDVVLSGLFQGGLHFFIFLSANFLSHHPLLFLLYPRATPEIIVFGLKLLKTAP